MLGRKWRIDAIREFQQNTAHYLDLVFMCQRALGGAERIVASLRPDELSMPTPCADWNVRQLIEHMIGVNSRFAALASGQPAPNPGRPVAPSTDDVAAAYAASARAALAGWRSPGALERTVPLSVGEMPGAEAICFHTGDQLMHTWDLAKATGRDRTLDPEVGTAVLERIRQRIVPEMRGSGRAFGPELLCPEDAPI